LDLKPTEIFIVTLLVILGFVVANFFIDHLYVRGVFERFALRVVFQAQFLALIYLFFESRDISRRLKTLESRMDGAGDE